MDKEKIKVLRERIPIALPDALKLLNQCDWDVEIAFKKFHDISVQEISSATDEADIHYISKLYSANNYNTLRTIESLKKKKQQEINCLSIQHGIQKKRVREIGFSLWAEKKSGDDYEDDKGIFIPYNDFKTMINSFESVFPFQNPYEQNEMIASFDDCGENFFDNQTFKIIVSTIEHMKSADIKTQQFLHHFIEWGHKKLAYAEIIIVYGNL